jgi:uncharacterized repeat protein (TIGR01451 family)
MSRAAATALLLAAVLLGSLLAPLAHAQAASGTKDLYLQDTLSLSRTPNAAVNTGGAVIAGQHNIVTSKDWTLAPAIAAGKSLVLSAGTINVNLLVACSTAGQVDTCAAWDQNIVSVQLLDGSTVIGTSNTGTTFSTTPGLLPLTITLASPYTLAAGHSLVLRVRNDGANGYNRPDLKVYQFYNAPSRVSFPTSTVINVDSVDVYAAPYPSTTRLPFHGSGSTVYVRAVVSDPFGSFDVNSAKVTIKDGGNATRLNAATMTMVADSGVATRTFEYEYTLPPNLTFAYWSASVTGREGTENTISHTAAATFGVGEPQLSVTTSHAGNFTAGTNASYAFDVHNSGGALSGTTTLGDTLPTGLTYISGIGTGWTCGAVGQVVTCTSGTPIAAGASLPPLTLNVAVAGSAPGSVDNVATIAHSTLEGGNSHAGNIDTTTILHPDLSGSSIAVLDLNGGDAVPGDTLRYTIALNESVGASAGSIAAGGNLPAGVAGFHVVSVPAGAIDASSPTGGSNGTGLLAVSGITVPAGGSASIVYEVTVPSVPAGTTIDSTVTITNPNGSGATPAAPRVTVSQSLVAATGNKILYVRDDATLTRTPQSSTNSAGRVIPGVHNVDSTADWTLVPGVATGRNLVLQPGSITFSLVLQCAFGQDGDAGNQCGNYKGNNRVSVQLLNGGSVVATSATQDMFNTTPELKTFTVTLASPVTIAAGNALVLRIRNGGTAGYARPALGVFQYYNVQRSVVRFATSTVVNVDSVSAYSAPYPATTTKGLYAPGDTVYLRAVASDPFGSADVSSASITVNNGSGVLQLGNVSMTPVAAPTAASRVFEYAYVVPSNAAGGYWNASVTAHEGTEGTVSHTGNGAFSVGLPPLSVAVSHTGVFTAGSNGSYSIVVHNNGSPLTGITTVTDTLPAGLGFVSGSGGWTCGAAGQVVTCTIDASLGTGADLPTLLLEVAVGLAAPASVDNSATVAHPMVNGGAPTQGEADPTVITHPDLSTSTLSVLDLNGGDADPGDVLRYTATLVATGTGSALGASVSADVPAGVTGFSVASIPAGSTNASVPLGGPNGSGHLSVTGIDVPAGGSVVVAFDVTVGGSATPGDTIDMSVVVANANGPGATPIAPTVTVSQSQAAASGNKLLYVYDNNTLTRTPQAAAGAGSVIPEAGASDWTLPPLQKAVVLAPGSTVTVSLLTRGSGSGGGDAARSMYVQLLKNGVTQLGDDSNVQNFTSTAWTLRTFTISVPASPATSLAAGDTIVLRVRNSSSGTGTRSADVAQFNAGQGSTVSLDTATVINVDQVDIRFAAYPATTSKSFYIHDDTIYVRAVVSDPFGSADISSATLKLTDAAGVVRANGVAMTQVADSGAATRTFEYQYKLPNTAATGSWTASVTGHEGSEGTVTHTANVAFGVGVSHLSVTTSHSGNFSAGSNAQYAMVVHNNGAEVTGTTTVTDTLPAGLTFVSGSGSGWTCGAVGQLVTCDNPTTIAENSVLPTLALTVAVAGTAPATLANSAAVSNPSIDGGVAQGGNIDTATVVIPNLSTSTNFGLDTDGGDADPGDTLQYTVTLVESAGAIASNVQVTSDLPAGIGGFSVASIPAGSTDASIIGGGANGTGRIQVTGITVPAGGSVQVVFNVTVAAGASPGDTIDNTATVANPNGPGAMPSATTITVSPSAVAAAGNKLLYVHDDLSLTRVPQSTTNTTGVLVAAGASVDWSLAPTVATGKTLALDAGPVPVGLVLQCTGGQCETWNPNQVSVELLNGTTSLGTSAVQSFLNTSPGFKSFTVTLSAPATIPAGGKLVLRVHNTATGGNAQGITVFEYYNAPSSLSLSTATVINVDSVQAYSAPYPSTTTKPFYNAGDVVYIRAMISDPFGGTDVSSARVTFTDAGGTVKLNNAAMTARTTGSGSATRVFEYAYTLSGSVAFGFWNASVKGAEGTEGTITHTANGAFGVGVPQLSVTTSHAGNFTAGAAASYSLLVHNNGSALTGTTTVVDTLPAGLAYVPAGSGGTGWSCSVAGQDVSCSNSTPIGNGQDLAPLVLNVSVLASAPSSLANAAKVAHTMVNGGVGYQGNVDTATVVHPDLSTSILSVVDLDGGDADPGDTLRYTLTLAESGGGVANGLSVADDIPAGVGGLSVVSIPAGSIDASTVGGGANGTGHLAVSGITVAANASATVVFDVVVAANATPGTTVGNSATVANPNGSGATPVAPTVTVSQSQVAASGNEYLYLRDSRSLTRVSPPASNSTGVAIAAGATADWTLAPVIATGRNLVLDAGSIAINLALQCPTCDPNGTSNVTVQLRNGATVIGTSAAQTLASNTPLLKTFTLTIASPVTVAAGSALTLRVSNGTKAVNVYQYYYMPSSIKFATSTVISVDSVAVYSGAYPAATTKPAYVHGDTVYVRATISNPFGSADVDHATVVLTDAGGTQRLVGATMTQVADSGAATRTFEIAYVVPATARIGSWTAAVTGHEGDQSTVTHTSNASFTLHGAVSLGANWMDAIAGDAVSLSIGGGSTPVAGTSTAPSTTTVATATSTANATLTLGEAFTTGSAGGYTIGLACVRNSDSAVVAVAGNGLSRTITMPTNSSVTCSWTNSKTVPLTVVKLSVVKSDPVNGTTNPKAIPGALVEYQIIVTNPATNPIDSDSVVVTDPIPLELRVADLGGGGSGPVAFVNGSTASGLTFGFTSLASTTDDVAFSNDDGATWTYTPVPDANGIDAAVTGIRVNPKGVFNANNAQFTLRFQVRIP